jgi:hypothetical protein
MAKLKFHCLMGKICDEFILSDFTAMGNQNFTAKVYCKLEGGGCEDDYDSKCAYFIEKFSRETWTNWIVYRRHGYLKRSFFRKSYKCQHSAVNKVKGKGTLMNTRCRAVIDFKFKKVNRNTVKNDPNLKSGLNCVIDCRFEHNHSILAAEFLGHLRCSNETIELFRSYFNSGMTPAVAKKYHEKKLIEGTEEENVLANTQLNPTLRQVIYLFDNWRTGKNSTSGTMKNKVRKL